MPKLPVLRLNQKGSENSENQEAVLAASQPNPATDTETPAIRRSRRHIERLQHEKAQLLERIAQKERAVQDQRWMTLIRKAAPGWSLETVVGGLAAAFAECQDDPSYFEEITAFGKTLMPDASTENGKP